MAYIRCSGNIGGSLKVRTASGNPCTFTTDLTDALVSLTADVVCGQDLHGEDKPYPAGGGVNLWDGVAESGYIYNGTEYPSTSYWRTKNYIPIAPNTEYYFRASANDGQINWYDINKTFISAEGSMGGADRVATSPANAYFVRFYQPNSSDTSDTGVNYPSTDHDYHPYENICPIVGHSELNLTRCGVNLFDNSNFPSGFGAIVATYNSDGTVTLNGTASGNEYFSIPINLPNNNYVMSVGNTSANANVHVSFVNHNSEFYGDNDLSTTSKVVNISGDISAIVFYVLSGTTLTDFTIKPMLELGSTPSAYEPYNGQTFTVAFGQTVYGGVYDKSGRLTITWAGTKIKNLGWYYDGDFQRFYTTDQVDIKHPPTQNDTPYILCDIYETIAFNSFNVSARPNNVISNPNANGRINIRDTRFTDTASFIASVGEYYLAYELATPIVIDVQSISVFAENGTNNITSDCGGDVDVSYLELIRGT